MDEHGGISTVWIAAVYGSLAILCGAVAFRGVTGPEPGLLTAGLLGLVVVGSTLPLALRRVPASPGSGEAAADRAVRAEIGRAHV